MSTITEESTIVWSKMMCPQCTAAKQLLKLNEITYEERMIGEVISAAKKICSEIIIIDSLSIDKTKSIALSLGANVFEQPWLGNGFQKRVGEEKCKNDWVLDIDADEIVTDEMTQEIKNL